MKLGINTYDVLLLAPLKPLYMVTGPLGTQHQSYIYRKDNIIQWLQLAIYHRYALEQSELLRSYDYKHKCHAQF